MNTDREHTGSPLRIVKLGGSLLSSDVLVRLPGWLRQQQPMINVVVTGGGAWVNAIREFHALHQLTEEQAHWTCIRAMGVTARLVAAVLPNSRIISDLPMPSSSSSATPRILVLDTESILRRQRGNVRLPACWDVTSDSIAAAVAQVADAAELVLLKSCSPPPGQTPGDWAANGFVDSFFPQAVAQLSARLRIVNATGKVWQESDVE